MPNMDHTGPVGHGQQAGLGEGHRHGQHTQGRGCGHGNCHRWGLDQTKHSHETAAVPKKTEE